MQTALATSTIRFTYSALLHPSHAGWLPWYQNELHCQDLLSAIPATVQAHVPRRKNTLVAWGLIVFLYYVCWLLLFFIIII